MRSTNPKTKRTSPAKHWSIAAMTIDAMSFIPSDERQFGRFQATWVYKAEQEAMATWHPLTTTCE